MTLHVVGLVASNFKRLRAVNIVPDPDGRLVRITGRNGHGKSSVLEALWAALAGGEAGRAIDMPIRAGESEAHVTLDLGEYVITKAWKQSADGEKVTTSLTVESPDGARYSSPQKLLDDLLGKRSFDPYAFTRLDSKAQVQTLIDVLGDDLEIDPAALERERKGVFERRTDIGRKVKELEGALAGYPDIDPELPAEEVSARDLLDELERARQINGRIDGAKIALERAQSAVEDAERVLAQAKATYQEKFDALQELPEPVRADLIGDKLGELDVLNARIRSQRDRVSVSESLTARRGEVAGLTARLKQIDQEKADGLAKATAKLPVTGIGIDETGVTLNGIPFSQASNAEKLRVSTALSMAFRPELRVLRIDNGEALDRDSLAIIEELAGENDYQVFVAEVADEPGVGIFIEDGSVAQEVAA